MEKIADPTRLVAPTVSPKLLTERNSPSVGGDEGDEPVGEGEPGQVGKTRRGRKRVQFAEEALETKK